MITSKIIGNGILRAVLIITLIATSLFFLYELKTIFIYIICAVILSLMANPVVEFLRKKIKFSNALAITTTIILLIGLLAGLVYMFVPLINSQGEKLSLLDASSIETKTNHLYTQIKDYLTTIGIDADKIVNKNKLASKFNFSFITNFLNSILGAFGSFGIGFACTLFITFFVLKDKVHFIANIKQLMPEQHQEKILNTIEKTNQMLSKYFIGLLLQTIIVFILYFIVLLIFGVKNAFIIAFLCALINIIPYIGAYLNIVIVAILTMLGNIDLNFQTETLPKTIYVMIGFFIIHFIDSNISQMLIFSKSVKSHPLEIFLVILISGVLIGVAGMIIAIPLYTIIKIVLKEFYPNNKFVQIFTKGI